MIKTKTALFLALLFPFISLILLTAYKASIRASGHEVILPIAGYDPRDLLSGHYLIYRIIYGVDGICASNNEIHTGYVCLDPKEFSTSAPENCKALIQGVCNYGVFTAGIERFYIPDSHAIVLEQEIRNKSASIVLSVNGTGKALVKDLLIDGRTWKSFIEK